MKFKLDENLPVELAESLGKAGLDAVTVVAQDLGGHPDPDIMPVCRIEGRALITLDVGFADIRSYPPESCPGIRRVGTNVGEPVRSGRSAYSAEVEHRFRGW